MAIPGKNTQRLHVMSLQVIHRSIRYFFLGTAVTSHTSLRRRTRNPVEPIWPESKRVVFLPLVRSYSTVPGGDRTPSYTDFTVVSCCSV